MSQPPADQPPRHPGYGPNPGAAPTPGVASAPQSHPQPHSGYGPNPGAVPPGYAQPAAPGYGQPYGQPAAPGQPLPGQPAPAAARNPLGLASLILGAIPSLLGLIFLLAQASIITAGDPSLFGAINGVGNVLNGLLGAAALITGFVAISRRGASKTLAAAGIALGAAALVSVIGTLLYTAVINLMYL